MVRSKKDVSIQDLMAQNWLCTPILAYSLWKSGSSAEALRQSSQAWFYAVLSKGEIGGTVPDIGWDLHQQAKEDQEAAVEEKSGD
jgi:hypothetical protein